MRLYLSSFRIGSCASRLVELVGVGAHAAVIANAMDAAPADVRREGVEREIVGLRDLGLRPEELDLRDFFDSDGVDSALARYDLLWVRGGDVFVLRYALARSSADTAIVNLLATDSVTYGGYSAGSCVLAPSLRGLELVDHPDAVSALYSQPPVWDGLGVLPYALVPHIDSPDHPESEACGRVADHYRRTATPHRTLRDGQIILVDGITELLCG